MTFKLAHITAISSATKTRRHTISKPDMYATAKPSEEWVPLVVTDGIAVLRLGGHYLLDEAIQIGRAHV